MSSYYDDLTKLGDAVKAAPPPDRKTGYYEALSGGASLEQGTGVKISRSAPTIADDPNRAVPIHTVFMSGFFPDDEKKLDYLSQQTGIPRSQWGVVDGQIVYSDPAKGDLVRAVPSVSGFKGPLDLWQRGTKWLAGEAIPSVPGAAGGVAGAAVANPFASVLTAMGVSGAVDVGRQAVGNLLIDRPIGDIDVENVAGQAALGGAGQTVAAGVGQLLNRNPLRVQSYDRAQAMDPAVVTQSRQNVAEGSAVGVPLSFGQATGLRSALAGERQLGRDPVTADIMDTFYRQQREKVQAAMQGQIDTLSPVQTVDEGVTRMRQGAGATIEAAKDTRRRAANRAYGNIEQATVGDETVAFLKADDALNDALAYVRGNSAYKREIGDLPDNSVKVLDLVKRKVDDDIKALQRAGRNNEARLLTQARGELVNRIDLEVPDYSRARAAFAGESPRIKAMEEGTIGRLASGEGTERIGEVRSLFNANLSNPAAVGRARTEFVRAGREEDWNAGVATYLRDTLDAAQKNQEGGPSARRLVTALYGTPQQKALLKNALTPEQYEGLNRVLMVVDRVAKTMPEGSPTATDAAGGQRLREQMGAGGRLLGRLLSPQRALDVGGAVGDRVSLKLSDEGMTRLAEAITRPDAVEQLRKLRMLSPNSNRATALTAQLLGLTAASEAGARDAQGQPPQE
jgi:DNA-binding TFAR19-related protein (PDSD5 family)